MINKLLALTGYSLVKSKDLHRYLNLGYVSCRETVENAAKKNMTVCEYVEKSWNQVGLSQNIVDNMVNLGVFDSSPNRICEIGSGTGIYLEKVLDICNPEYYESYEIDEEWAKWLSAKYGIKSQKCDGKTLAKTKDSSLDLVQCHGVFVYLPFLITYNYFLEMSRVIKEGGILVFDCYVEECMSDKLVSKWLDTKVDWPTILPQEYILTFFKNKKFEYKGSFFTPSDVGVSKYFIFRKLHS